MTAASHIAALPTMVRPSARVARVAGLLDCDESDVRRMLRSGELEGHSKGVRGKRVYLDSVATYQESRAIVPEVRGPAPTAKRITVSSAAHRAAAASLRESGILH
jgi:hypothetical protein